MKSNAPGQLLGYAYQFPRALFHLLKGRKGDVVCIEVLGDVATKRADGKVIAEEDKSSTVGNPLTDRSSDLWKTLSNWIKGIKDGEFDAKKTNFVLYSNQSGRHGIVNEFSNAQSETEVKTAVENARKQLTDINSDHEIWPHYDFCMNQNESLLNELIGKFELQTEDGAGYDEVRRELSGMLFSDSQIDFLMDALGGWLQRQIAEKIADRKNAIVSWEDYAKQFKTLFERIRLKELIDFALLYPPKNDEIQQHAQMRPPYLRQLEKINASEEETVGSIIDFLRAKINRDKWIETEIIDNDVAVDFQSKLESFWKEARKKIELTQKKMNVEDKGQLLLAECKSRQETIRGIPPPDSTIAGTYHTLADKLVLGWHPEWEKIFLSDEKN